MTTAKKKTTKKPKPKPEAKPSIPEFNIPTEEPTIKLFLGETLLEGTILSFHRLSMQGEADAIDEYGQSCTGDQIVRYFARKLENEFNLQADSINENMAYRVYEIVHDQYHRTKKK